MSAWHRCVPAVRAANHRLRCPPCAEVPNRSLVSLATGVDPQALSDCELDVLKSLDWDVAAVLRARGLLA